MPWVDTRMAALHGLATVAAGLALREGDRLRRALAAALRPLWRPLTVVTHPVRPAVPGGPAPVDVPSVVPQSAVRVTRCRRRKPPRRPAVALARALAPAPA